MHSSRIRPLSLPAAPSDGPRSAPRLAPIPLLVRELQTAALDGRKAPNRTRKWASALLCLSALSSPSTLLATTLPTDFEEEVLVSGLDKPTEVAFAADGTLFIAEKKGTVWVKTAAGLQSSPLIVLDEEINNAGDRGLLGLAVDPQFADNGYVYLLYAVDPEYGAPEESADQPTFGRLTRYTAEQQDGSWVADLDSRLVLIGEEPSEGIPSCYNTHSVGALHFGEDGSLYVSAGDGASKDYIDYGQNVTSWSHYCEDLFGPEQDIGALRAQSLDTMAGKVLRIDPATGLGLPDNPFYTGDPTSARARIWAYGLRQPFRFTVRPDSPDPGTLYLGDVGSSNFEELNQVFPGDNLGWPCYEGNSPNYLYQDDENTEATCAEVTDGVVTWPIIAWSHSDTWPAGFSGSASVGGTFYSGTRYPQRYRGQYFFADYTESWLRTLEVSDDDVTGSDALFAEDADAPVALSTDPVTGNLVYVSIATGQVRMIHYLVEDHAPVAVISADPPEGRAPLEVHFSSAASYDDDGDLEGWQWDFGDGSSSSDPNPAHTFGVSGTYTVTLTLTDSTGRTGTASLVVPVDNSYPQARILAPEDGLVFEVPTVLDLVGEGTDLEDGTLPESAYHWTVNLLHDTHVHYDWLVATGSQATLSVEDHGEGDISYEINLLVEDSGGLTTTQTVVVYPDSGALDSDGDGLSNDQESALGTDPYRQDTDGDGLTDGEEVAAGSNPLDASSPGASTPGSETPGSDTPSGDDDTSDAGTEDPGTGDDAPSGGCACQVGSAADTRGTGSSRSTPSLVPSLGLLALVLTRLKKSRVSAHSRA